MSIESDVFSDSLDTTTSITTAWTCPYCTVINNRSSTRCETCQQPRPGHRKRQNQSSHWWPWTKKKPRRWVCDKCTFSNNPTDNKCALCGKDKKGFFSNLFSGIFTSKNTPPSVAHKSTSSEPSDWTCSQCTYRNNSSAIECEHCTNCKAWDDTMHHSDSFEIIRSPDERSQDNDIIMTSHNGRQHDDGTPVDNVMVIDDDVMVTSDDVMITNDDVMISSDDKKHYWECADCTYHNNISNSKCATCGSTNKVFTPVAETRIMNNKTSNFNPATHWACPHCSLHNSKESVYCKACMNKRTVKEKTPVTSFNPLMQWKCQDCSLYNSNSDANCIVCDSRRNRDVAKKQDVTINTANQWQCVHCSFYNDTGNNTCSACGGIFLPKVAMVTNKPSTSSSLESSMRRTRLYTNHTAYISISVTDKRNLINQDAMSQYNYILEFCKQDKSTFIDPDFTPSHKSLYRDPSHPSHYWRVTQWCRPRDIRSHDSTAKWTVYRNPEPGDIAQGALGTCWFLSALSVLAEKPELVEQIIVNKQYTEYGIYLLRLCKDGCWSVIQVDDHLPCNKDKMLVFSKGLRKQLWVPLIEKALAKLYGSYEAIESGFVLSGLSILTGYPCENIRLQNDDRKKKDEVDDNLLWAKLLSFREAGFLMGASCGGRDTISSDECEAKGLQYAHAYSILDVQQVDHYRLLKLRNPHGHGSRQSWNGDWSDGSSRWTNHLKQQLLPHGASQGIFWMSLRDLMRYFSDIDVCRYRPSWFEERVQGRILPHIPAKMTVMAVEILDTCEVDICMYQPTNR